MESYLKNWLGLTRLSELKRFQLLEQRKLDDKLQSLSFGCGTTVSKLLLELRRQARDHQQAILEANLADTFKVIEKEAEDSLQVYTLINKTAFNPNIPMSDFERCAALEKLTYILNPETADKYAH